jgi:hypothetical protein
MPVIFKKALSSVTSHSSQDLFMRVEKTMVQWQAQMFGHRVCHAFVKLRWHISNYS